MNAPARFESFLLLSGEKKWVIVEVIGLDHEDGTVLVKILINAHRPCLNVSYRITITKDTKVPNAAIFTVNKEDHTLGNQLMQ